MVQTYAPELVAPAAALLNPDRTRPRGVAPDVAAAAALDAIDYGVMLLDAVSAQVLLANRTSREECGTDGPLVMEQQRVRGRTREAQRDLEAALAKAACDRRSMLSLEGAQRHTLLAVLPLVSCADDAAPRALLLFSRRELCESLSVGFFARLHALTPTEEHVLKGLCRGLKPARIALESGVALSTVRSQVSSVRLKTGSQSIGELIHKVATLPPIPPALAGGAFRDGKRFDDMRHAA